MVAFVADRYLRLIDAGKFASQCGDPGLAEVVLVRSLEHADDFYGKKSDVSRFILKDLLQFYAGQGDYDGFKKLQYRMLFDMELPAVPE